MFDACYPVLIGGAERLSTLRHAASLTKQFSVPMPCNSPLETCWIRKRRLTSPTTSSHKQIHKSGSNTSVGRNSECADDKSNLGNERRMAGNWAIRFASGESLNVDSISNQSGKRKKKYISLIIQQLSNFLLTCSRITKVMNNYISNDVNHFASDHPQITRPITVLSGTYGAVRTR